LATRRHTEGMIPSRRYLNHLIPRSPVTPEMSPDDERAAVNRVIEGDRESLATLYTQHGTVAYNAALRLLRDEQDAEDVIQKMFVFRTPRTEIRPKRTPATCSLHRPGPYFAQIGSSVCGRSRLSPLSPTGAVIPEAHLIGVTARGHSETVVRSPRHTFASSPFSPSVTRCARRTP